MINDFVVAIGVDNTMLHVGRAEDLTDHLVASRSHAEVESKLGIFHQIDEDETSHELSSRSLEFFDGQGRRLVLRRRDSGAAFFLKDQFTQQAIEPGLLLDRINLALSHMQEVLDKHPELGDGGSIVIGKDEIPQGRHTRVPRPAGSLNEVLSALAVLFFPAGSLHPTHVRGWFHNLGHAAGVF